MRHFYFTKLLVSGLLALAGIGGSTFSASADTLAVQFSPTDTSFTATTPANAFGGNVTELGYDFTVTAGNSFVVTALGAFANNRTAFLNTETIGLFAGTVGVNQTLNFANALATVQLGNGHGGTFTADGTWIFNPISQVTLTAGNYFIVDLYGNLNDPLANVTTSTVVTESPTGLLLTQRVACGTNLQCNSLTIPPQDYFGPNFTTLAAVPGPVVGAGLPGMIMALGGLLAWRRKSKGAVLAA